VIDWALESDLERSLAAAHATRARIAPHVVRTPLVASADGRRLLKLETLQRTGSFKVRGAAAAITAADAPSEVVAASTGNHGLAVATVARALGLACRVFVPAAARPVKLARLRQTGARLELVDGDPLEAELQARAQAQRTPGAVLVPPYNDPEVVLGQASIGLELLEDAGAPPRALYAGVGGGGLIAGIALAVRARWPQCRIVGCLPAASPAMRDAIAAGDAVASPVAPTLADATAGNIEPGALTIAICAALVDELLVIEEREIADAMRAAVWEERLVIEGGAALALAGSLRGAQPGPQIVVLSGGAVDRQTLLGVLADDGDAREGQDHR
jgi:threonine dehydratase